MPDSDNKKRFLMFLTNLRDDFMLGRRTSIYPGAMVLIDAWKDLSLDEKKACREKSERMLPLFITNLPGVGGNQFLEQYRATFTEEYTSLDGRVHSIKGDAEDEAARSNQALEIFQQILAEIQELPKD